jgi:hypothetical protein
MHFQDLITILDALRSSTEPDVAELFAERAGLVNDADDWYEWWSEAERLYRLTRLLREHINQRFAAHLGKDSLRQGDEVLRVGSYPVRKPVDPDPLWDFLGPDARLVIPIERVRITALRAVAERRGLDPEVIEDTFIDTTWSEPRLQVVPITKARNWEQRLRSGERGRYER